MLTFLNLSKEQKDCHQIKVTSKFWCEEFTGRIIDGLSSSGDSDRVQRTGLDSIQWESPEERSGAAKSVWPPPHVVEMFSEIFQSQIKWWTTNPAICCRRSTLLSGVHPKNFVVLLAVISATLSLSNTDTLMSLLFQPRRVRLHRFWSVLWNPANILMLWLQAGVGRRPVVGLGCKPNGRDIKQSSEF